MSTLPPEPSRRSDHLRLLRGREIRARARLSSSPEVGTPPGTGDTRLRAAAADDRIPRAAVAIWALIAVGLAPIAINQLLIGALLVAAAAVTAIYLLAWILAEERANGITVVAHERRSADQSAATYVAVAFVGTIFWTAVFAWWLA